MKYPELKWKETSKMCPIFFFDIKGHFELSVFEISKFEIYRIFTVSYGLSTLFSLVVSIKVIYFLVQIGAPVAQLVKRWPTDLADRVRSALEVTSSQP